MPHDDQSTYGVESHDDSPPEQAPGSGGGLGAAARDGDDSTAFKIDLEAEAAEREGEPRSPGRCPDCGAPLPPEEGAVCLRCLSSGAEEGVEGGGLAAGADGEGEEDGEGGTAHVAPPPVDAKETENLTGELSPEGRGGLWLPGGVAALSALIVLFGTMFGSGGPYRATIEIGFGLRIEMLTHMVLLALAVAASTLVGLLLLGALLARPVGSLQLAAVRVLAIAFAIEVTRFVGVDGATGRFIIFAVLWPGVFLGLSLAFFRMKIADAASMGLMSIVLLCAMWLASFLVRVAIAAPILPAQPGPGG